MISPASHLLMLIFTSTEVRILSIISCMRCMHDAKRIGRSFFAVRVGIWLLFFFSSKPPQLEERLRIARPQRSFPMPVVGTASERDDLKKPAFLKTLLLLVPRRNSASLSRASSCTRSRSTLRLFRIEWLQPRRPRRMRRAIQW